jgi:Cdc6-like AAA superfamily ATPase
MSAEKIELIIKAIESGDVRVALNLARSALETMNKEGEVKESSSDYPMPESMLYYNGP